MKPLLQNFIGLNVHTVLFKPELYLPTARVLRDYHGDEWDTTYGVEGKPSYQIIKSGFARIQRDSAPAVNSSSE